MSIFDSVLLDYVFVGWLVIEGTIAMVMLYNYYIKPWFKMRGKVKNPKGLYGSFSYWDPETGKYLFDLNNINLSKLGEQLLAKLTGALPKSDPDSAIKETVKKNMQSAIQEVLAEAVDKEKLKEIIRKKIEREIERQVNDGK